MTSLDSVANERVDLETRATLPNLEEDWQRAVDAHKTHPTGDAQDSTGARVMHSPMPNADRVLATSSAIAGVVLEHFEFPVWFGAGQFVVLH